MEGQIKNILFDFGGVIVDITKEKAIKRFKEIGFANIEDFLTDFRQSGIFLEYETGALKAKDFYNEFRKLAGNDKITDEEIDSGWLAFLGGIPAYKFDLLEELGQHYNMYLLSNTNPTVMGWAHTSDFSPSGKNISDYFIKCYESFELGHAKPDEEAYLTMLADGTMKPEETLFLDDGPKNIEVAKKLGFHTYQANQEEDLREVFVKRGLLK